LRFLSTTLSLIENTNMITANNLKIKAMNTLSLAEQCKIATERKVFPRWASTILNGKFQDDAVKIISAEIFLNENGNKRFVLIARIGTYVYTAKGDGSQEVVNHIINSYYAPIFGEEEDVINVVRIKVLYKRKNSELRRVAEPPERTPLSCLSRTTTIEYSKT